MSDLPEPLRAALAELDAADRNNAAAIKQLREDHGNAITALQTQYERMEKNQRDILERLGEVPTRDDIRIAVAEGITGPLQKAYESVPVHIANALVAKQGQAEQQESDRANDTATRGNFWLKAAAIVALIVGAIDGALNYVRIH